MTVLERQDRVRQRHGGSIDLDSTQAPGTTFNLDVPLDAPCGQTPPVQQ